MVYRHRDARGKARGVSTKAHKATQHVGVNLRVLGMIW